MFEKGTLKWKGKPALESYSALYSSLGFYLTPNYFVRFSSLDNINEVVQILENQCN
jgi:hypothetical protein